MMPQNKKTLIGCLLAFLACVAAISIAGFLHSKINNSSQAIKNAKLNLANWAQKDNYTRQLTIDREKIINDINQINQGFLPTNQTVKLIEQLENMASQERLSQTINSAQQITKPAMALTLNIDIYGRLENIIRYLTKLENMAYFNKLTKIQIDRRTSSAASAESTNTTNSLHANLEIMIFTNQTK